MAIKGEGGDHLEFIMNELKKEGLDQYQLNFAQYVIYLARTYYLAVLGKPVGKNEEFKVALLGIVREILTQGSVFLKDDGLLTLRYEFDEISDEGLFATWAVRVLTNANWGVVMHTNGKDLPPCEPYIYQDKPPSQARTLELRPTSHFALFRQLREVMRKLELDITAHPYRKNCEDTIVRITAYLKSRYEYPNNASYPHMLPYQDPFLPF
jgi:hypothetical protein